ncbi:MAG: hypothetical protein CSA97_00450, partial [Bacteroidetes bacterium]
AVTNAQYDRFLAAMEAEGGDAWESVKLSGSRSPFLSEGFKGADQPVVMVSHGDALAFCRWMGHGVALPTEAQWEYACRAGATTRYSCGDDMGPEHANFWGSVWEEGGVGVASRTRAAGQYGANAFGLYDMHGNVWEWCADWYGEGYYGNCRGREMEGELVVDPAGPPMGSCRVGRGGSWRTFGSSCRSAFRARFIPGIRNDILGFRVVAPLAP